MYFFLSNLSILDICSTSLPLPKMLDSFFTGNKSISFCACMTQIYFFQAFTGTEFFLLTAMAYDRYVAICDPLHYSHVMKKSICILLAVGSFVIGSLDALPFGEMLSKLSYCKSNEINHFFCETAVLIKLSCSDPHQLEVLIFVEGIFVGFTPFLLILISYIFIISTILKIRCTEGRHKAFSTCASHLTSVILLYMTLICIYMRPASMYSPAQNKLFSLLYTALIPMLNPIIYSLRNREIKTTLRKIRRIARKLEKKDSEITMVATGVGVVGEEDGEPGAAETMTVVEPESRDAALVDVNTGLDTEKDIMII
ncbi:olfactory receptor 1F1-like [Microcaecilia unicolor]|uniref:Olfactory receptor n=1 Tax=Microcaecilia unicolor TaxID=1415580 RepID=A0A6P7WHC6_9AMPH|nr:olfactory receptor 1F1-like [Microcaecilia unicolor]